VTSRPVGTLALEYVGRHAVNAQISADAGFTTSGHSRDAHHDLLNLVAERDALRAALEASRADAARLAEALSYARPRHDTPEAIQRHGDAMDAHRALSGGAL